MQISYDFGLEVGLAKLGLCYKIVDIRLDEESHHKWNEPYESFHVPSHSEGNHEEGHKGIFHAKI
jgi:hypothetical protein